MRRWIIALAIFAAAVFVSGYRQVVEARAARAAAAPVQAAQPAPAPKPPQPPMRQGGGPWPDAQAAAEQPDTFIEVAFMVRGYCYAKSSRPDTEALGGFGSSDNTARPIKTAKAREAGALYLLAQPEVTLPLGKEKGMRLVLVNATGSLVWFKASDSRISIVQEAKVGDGDWRPIEYLSSSWCGNSYHRVSLDAEEFWQFAAPRYRGPVPAKLRFRLSLDSGDIVSNEFDGSLHPDQFTVKQGHNPQSIMDPYLD